MTAILLGLVVSPVCFLFVAWVKSRLGYDDSLDVFGVHGIGGIVGAIGTGIVADPAPGGQGWLDYKVIPAVAGTYAMEGQLLSQFQAVVPTPQWADRQDGAEGKRWSVRVDLGGRLTI